MGHHVTRMNRVCIRFRGHNLLSGSFRIVYQMQVRIRDSVYISLSMFKNDQHDESALLTDLHRRIHVVYIGSLPTVKYLHFLNTC